MNSGPNRPDQAGAWIRALADLGYVAGDIAHDFNGLLTGILGYASYLKALLPKDDQKKSAADKIEISARRAAELAYQMIEYSHKKTPTSRPVQIDQIVGEAIDALSSAAAGKVQILAKLETPPGQVLGDPDTLIRALFHLGENAIEAMPEGGQLTFSTRPFLSDGSVEFGGVPVPEGNYVSLTVSDTGCGIPESLRAQVFVPFFTTKPGGNGIGLPFVNRCARKHGGFLRMENRADGTAFEVLLPTQTSIY